MSNSLVIKEFYKGKPENNENFDYTQEKPLKNYADYFFKVTNVDATAIDVTNSVQVLSLIKKNIDHITKWLFNNLNSGNNIFAGISEDQLKAFLGQKSIEVINQNYNELIKNIDEVCYFIKQNDQNPRETLDMLGINYHHSNLPPECEGLF